MKNLNSKTIQLLNELQKIGFVPPNELERQEGKTYTTVMVDGQNLLSLSLGIRWNSLRFHCENCVLVKEEV